MLPAKGTWGTGLLGAWLRGPEVWQGGETWAVGGGSARATAVPGFSTNHHHTHPVNRPKEVMEQQKQRAACANE